jgi:peptide/nickel transport system permease protein
VSKSLQTLRFVANRLTTAVLTLFVVTVLVFTAMHLIPGDYAQLFLGPLSTTEARAALTERLGLDEPLPVQFFSWVGQVFTGNLGESFSSGVPTTQLLEERLPVTAELALLALVLTLVVGIPLAIISGTSESRFARGLSRLLGSTAISVPDFVIGGILVFIFSSTRTWLTVGSYVPFSEDPIRNLQSMALPAATLAVFGVAIVARTGRDAIAAARVSPHVLAAIARGESPRHVLFAHMLRNSAIPLVTVIATYVGYLLGGAVIVESLFSIPGVGQALLVAVQQRDYSVVQGIVLIAAAFFILINMLSDLVYGIIDPRVKAATA